MPLAINPNSIYEAILESDKELESENPPKFLYRYLTGKQQLELTKMMDEIEDIKEGSEALEQVFRAASIGLIGWKNIKNESGKEIPFAANRLIEVVGMTEAMELSRKLLSQKPTFDELKNSESPSQSDTAAGAETAEE